MSDEIQPFDIRTNAEWQRLGATAENRPTFVINQAEVPDRFRHWREIARKSISDRNT